MPNTWIKICATTNLADAQASVSAGANALGFLFADSRRQVEPSVAKEIIAELPAGIETFGVFVNEPADHVIKLVRETGLSGVQLHGDESPAYVKLLREMSGGKKISIIKSISAHASHAQGMGGFSGGDALVDALIVDSGTVTMRGGTGQVFDWLRTSDFVMDMQQRANVVIAGGLSPENVAAAISLFRPWGVDVVTGVEREFGKKDHEKIRSFIDNVRTADAQNSSIAR